MKKILSLLLIAILALVPLSVSAESEIKVLLDGVEVEFDQPPVIISDRTMVPVRAIYESLGAEVKWDPDTRTASGTRNGIIVSFTIDNPTVVINYNEKAIDAPATIVNDRTLVPVRALAEGFGVTVDWDAATRTAILKDEDTSGVIENYEVDTDTFNYTGQIANGIPEGYGTGILTDLTDTYFIGSWENGAPAIGRVYTDDAAAFEWTGFFGYDHGALSGYSEVTLSSGEVFHGNFENGAMSGYGELYLPDGTYYKGEFKNNAMHGYGEIYDAATGKTLAGTWYNGEFIG